MRYVIGCTIIDKATGNVSDGIIGTGSFGIDYFLTEENFDKCAKTSKNQTYVYTSLEDVIREANERCVSYRRDDVWTKDKHWLKSKSIRRFYPLKVDSNNFKFNVVPCEQEKDKKKFDYKKVYEVTKK